MTKKVRDCAGRLNNQSSCGLRRMRTPCMRFWRERMQAAKAVEMVDNADALTTCPQQLQLTNRFKRSRSAGPFQLDHRLSQPR